MSSDQKIFHRTNLNQPVDNKEKRPVILHFHTFKNAGSSVDAILQQSFPEAWANYDGPVPEFFIHHSEMATIARNRAQLKAISSHQIRLPVPDFIGVEFLPIVFIRRPELRIASIWRFTRQRNDEHPATLLAQKYSLGDWIAHTLEQITPQPTRNAQANLFCYKMDQRQNLRRPGAEESAISNVTALPLMGLVEQFDRSMQLYEKLYQPKIPDFKFIPVKPQNVTDDPAQYLDQRLDKIRKEIGSEMFDRLQVENELDIKLYEIAVEKMEEVASRTSILSTD